MFEVNIERTRATSLSSFSVGNFEQVLLIVLLYSFISSNLLLFDFLKVNNKNTKQDSFVQL